MIEKASEFGASAAMPLVGGGDNTHLSAGAMLREAREAHGLHLEMVAAALKVTPQKLEALENDDIESLPDAVFARALAASVCRALRIDPAPVLAKLPGAQKSGLADGDRTMSKGLRPTGPRSAGASSGLPSRALLIVVLILLVGAAGLFWLPQSVFDQAGATFARLTGRGASSAASAPAETPAAGGATTASGANAAATEAAAPPVSAVEPTPPAPPAAAPASAASAASTASAAPSTTANDLLVIAAREESWVTVTDSTGKQLLRRAVKPGETVGVSGSLPLAVVIGRASVVDVQVRGKPFDLAPLTRSGGVARFEVKS